MGGLDEADIETVTTLNVVLSSLSFVGSCTIILSFSCFPELRTFAFRLVFFLSISEAFYALFNFLGFPEPGSAACRFQSIGLSFFGTSMVLWTSIIASTLRAAVFSTKDVARFKGSERRYHCFAWGLAAVLAVLPALTDSYGPAGSLCWIDASSTGALWRFVQFYMPLWICMSYNVWVYWTTMRRIRRALLRAGGSISRARMPLLLYPLILLVCWLLATVNRVQNLIAPEQPQFWLYALGLSFAACQGLLHAIAYGMTSSVQRVYRRILCAGHAQGDDESLETTDSESESMRAGESDGVMLAPLKGGYEESMDGKDDGGDTTAVSAAASRPRRGSGPRQLKDVSHQIRSMYLQGLGVLELAGFQSHDDAYSTLTKGGWDTFDMSAESAAEAGAAVKQKNGITATYFTMFKSFVGIGILTMPHAYMQAGYIGASFGLVVIAIISYKGMVYLLDGQQSLVSTGVLKPDELVSFTKLGVLSVGATMGRVIDFALVSSQIGFCIAYILFIGSNVSHSLREASLADIDEKLVVIIAATAAVPLVWLNSLKRLAPAALAADVVIVFGLVTVFFYDFGELSAPEGPPEVDPLRLGTLPLFFGVAVFSFEGIGMVVPIRQSMAEPEKFKGVLRNTIISLTTLLVCFGTLSYLAYGDKTSDMSKMRDGVLALDSPCSPFCRLSQSPSTCRTTAWS